MHNPVESAGADGWAQEPGPFTSTCPGCEGAQLQQDLSAADLERLLHDVRPIEAYCVMGDQLWPITVRERVGLAKVLAANEHLLEPVGEAVVFTSVECDEFWDLCPRERAVLARALFGSGGALRES
jgi:hypothetical protein